MLTVGLFTIYLNSWELLTIVLYIMLQIEQSSFSLAAINIQLQLNDRIWTFNTQGILLKVIFGILTYIWEWLFRY